MSNTTQQKKTLFVLTDGIDFYKQFIKRVEELKSVHESLDQVVNSKELPFYNKDIITFLKNLDIEFFADEHVFLAKYDNLKHQFETDHTVNGPGIKIRRIIFIPKIESFPFSIKMNSFFDRSYIKDLEIYEDKIEINSDSIVSLAMHLEYKMV